jgi:FKBP-type peptidyl-prolyl cis-trans isomerase
MRKSFVTTVNILAAAFIFLGAASAQQTPAPSTPAQQAPATQTQKPALAPQSQEGAAKPAPATPAPAPPTIDSVVVPGLDSEKAKVSYAIGMMYGSGLHRQSIEVDDATFDQGFKDSVTGGKTLLTEDQMRMILNAYQGELRQKAQEKARVAAEKNKADGAAFLEANKTKEGVVALPSGLQYKILTAGTGPKPVATDTVMCNYRGTLIDGTEFDSSAKHGGQPATFGVTGVIKGWTEALELMPVGSKWELFIPSDLAYGERGGPGGSIGPNSALIFEIELVSIKAKPQPAQPAAPAPSTAPNPGATPKPQ